MQTTHIPEGYIFGGDLVTTFSTAAVEESCVMLAGVVDFLPFFRLPFLFLCLILRIAFNIFLGTAR